MQYSVGSFAHGQRSIPNTLSALPKKSLDLPRVARPGAIIAVEARDRSFGVMEAFAEEERSRFRSPANIGSTVARREGGCSSNVRLVLSQGEPGEGVSRCEARASPSSLAEPRPKCVRRNNRAAIRGSTLELRN